MNHTSLCQSKQQQALGHIVKEQTLFLFFPALGNSDYVTHMFVFSCNLFYKKKGSIRLILFSKFMFIVGVADPSFYPKEKVLL